MATQPLEALFDNVLPECPGVSQPFAKHAILQAVIEWCKRTRMFTMTATFDDPGTLVARQFSATPFFVGTPALLPSNSQILSIESVYWLGQELDPVDVPFLEGYYGAWQAKTGLPIFFTQERPDAYWLVPVPGSSPAVPNVGATQMRVSYGPAQSATVFDQVLYDMHREALAAGAKGKLMVMPNKPWSSPEIGQAYLNFFDTRIESARIRAMRGTKRAPLKVQPRAY